MRGDAVGACLDRGERGAHRIGPVAAPRVTQGRNMINVNAEAQRRRIWHGADSLEFGGVCLIPRSRKAASRRMSGRIMASWFERAQGRLLTTRKHHYPLTRSTRATTAFARSCAII